MADDIVTQPCCDVRPCGCADARMVIDHLQAEVDKFTEWNARYAAYGVIGLVNQLEAERALADQLAEVVKQYMNADNWTHDEGFIAVADAVAALTAYVEARRG